MGIGKFKENPIWWNLIKDIADTKSKYNYQLEVAYDLKYNKVHDLKTAKATGVILKCFKNLQPVYEILTQI